MEELLDLFSWSSSNREDSMTEKALRNSNADD
jgi:hypothetical protein